ncbi:uncharacterized protein LOC143257318 isoform X2 [Tachypleus tridentatus]|uniref:uncharacterized protein LOC143257318 isoform X2 n=1 Tax=Tachypleus tridentatus TaxID=6853 RepID=UPI003FD38FC7
MDILLVISNISRLIILIIVYLLNFQTLIKLVLYPRSCLHVLTSGAVLLTGLVYLGSWTPYVAYSLANGEWPVLDSSRYCLLQCFITTEAGFVLLSLLAVRLLYGYLIVVYKQPQLGARTASLATCLAWLVPQLLYDVLAVYGEDNGTDESLYFLDSLLVIPSNGNSTSGYKVGFMICLQTLGQHYLTYLKWQYMVLTLPPALVIVYCIFRLLMAPTRLVLTETKEPLPPPLGNSCSGPCNRLEKQTCGPECRNEVFIDVALYYNFIWLTLLRPLTILYVLYNHNKEEELVYYVDLGSHLVLSFTTVFSPFSAMKVTSSHH